MAQYKIPTPGWYNPEKPRGLKSWDYCGRRTRYFCECNFLNPVELEAKDKPCPVCGFVHTEFMEIGF